MSWFLLCSYLDLWSVLDMTAVGFYFYERQKSISLGMELHRALENGVSMYPELAGRFPQVSGVQFQVDPQREPGERIDAQTVLVKGRPLQYDKVRSHWTTIDWDVTIDCIASLRHHHSQSAYNPLSSRSTECV